MFAELLAGVSSSSGPVVRGELGARITENVGAFGFGQWTPRESTTGAGVRVTW